MTEKDLEIQRLRQRISALEKERDEAVADLAVEKDCRFCKFYDKPFRGWLCGLEDYDCVESDKWEWRGVQK